MADRSSFATRVRSIPLRLTTQERSMLRVLEGALQVSEYTDKVDTVRRANKLNTIVQQLHDLFAVLSGLLHSIAPRSFVQGRSLADNAGLFANVFEVGRRHKIMNPDKMRTSYGKLMHMLQDTAQIDVRDAVGFDCIADVQTVEDALEELGLSALLGDDDLELATRTVAAEQGGAKQAAIARLCAWYGEGDKVRADTVERCVLSIADDTALTDFHVDPVDEMLGLLHANFGRGAPERPHFSLQISAGRHGARLSHSHSTQFMFVEQTLRLWREILSHISLMWGLAEGDMLDGSGYRLRDTGQGLHRLASAPQVSRFMQNVLHKLQAQAGGRWVGSSAVHMGDNDVPNALVWIDKYTQVPRLLGPVIATVRELERLVETPGVADYVSATFGSVDDCRKSILTDFFRHAFDGSGADNYYDAGSCIDGRLTSAWNWCQKLEKKSYCHLFKMAGFQGFDGSFKS